MGHLTPLEQLGMVLGPPFAALVWLIAARACMRFEGVTPRFRFAKVLFASGALVMLVVVASGGAYWYLSGTFHPVWVIIMIMGLMPMDAVLAVRRDLKTRST